MFSECNPPLLWSRISSGWAGPHNYWQNVSKSNSGGLDHLLLDFGRTLRMRLTVHALNAPLKNLDTDYVTVARCLKTPFESNTSMLQHSFGHTTRCVPIHLRTLPSSFCRSVILRGLELREMAHQRNIVVNVEQRVVLNRGRCDKQSDLFVLTKSCEKGFARTPPQRKNSDIENSDPGFRVQRFEVILRIEWVCWICTPCFQFL